MKIFRKKFLYLVFIFFFLSSFFDLNEKKVSGIKVFFKDSFYNCEYNFSEKKFITCENFNSSEYKFDAEKNIVRNFISLEIDFDEDVFLVDTWSGTISEILISLGFRNLDLIKIEPNLNEFIFENKKIQINSLNEVFLNGEKKIVSSKTIKESLKEIGFSEDEILKFSTYPEKNSKIFNGMKIFMYQSSSNEIIEEEILKFEEKIIYDSTISEGVQKILSEGQNGLKVKKYKISEENGEVISKDLISEKIEIEKIDRKILIGTKKKESKEDSKFYIGKATWYGWKGPDGTWEYQDYNKNLPSSDWYGFGCASRDYPKGTKLLVTNLANSKSMICMVNDYGPEINENDPRIIDLSQTGFSQIANYRLGKINVRVEEA